MHIDRNNINNISILKGGVLHALFNEVEEETFDTKRLVKNVKRKDRFGREIAPGGRKFKISFRD